MLRKTLTVSEQAYNALARVREKEETLTNLILRLTRKTTKGDLLEYLRSTGPNSQLADQNTGRADDEVRDTGGKRIQVVEASEGLMLKPIPRMEDWAGADAGKYSYAKMVKELDNLRKRWR